MNQFTYSIIHYYCCYYYYYYMNLGIIPQSTPEVYIYLRPTLYRLVYLRLHRSYTKRFTLCSIFVCYRLQ